MPLSGRRWKKACSKAPTGEWRSGIAPLVTRAAEISVPVEPVPQSALNPRPGEEARSCNATPASLSVMVRENPLRSACPAGGAMIRIVGSIVDCCCGIEGIGIRAPPLSLLTVLTVLCLGPARGTAIGSWLFDALFVARLRRLGIAGVGVGGACRGCRHHRRVCHRELLYRAHVDVMAC